MKPDLCVVTPVWNGEKYLADTIESVLGQTLQNWEYVIVDGASEDNSVTIARDYAKNDNRIKVISEPDKGMYDALFKGFEKTTAPICCWINSDDKFMPWSFEIVTKYMKYFAVDWVTGIPAQWNEKGLLHNVSFPLWYPRLLIRLGLFHGRCLGWIQQESIFFKRCLLNKINSTSINSIRNRKYAGDFFLWTEFARYSNLWTIPAVVSGFRSHSSNLSRNADAYFREISEAGYSCNFLQIICKPMKVILLPIAFYKYRKIWRQWYKEKK